MLWFAWKIVLLQYHKQRSSVVTFVVCRCDLLEKSYFCSITNSGLRLIGLFFLVVICLKNRTFAVSQTANTKNGRGYVLLWFAWKIVLLQYHKQRIWKIKEVERGCDLLEKSYFCSITNSSIRRAFALIVLWFAWKIVLLQYHKQQALAMLSTSSVVICLKNRTFAVSQTAHMSIPCSLACCDLLEKSYFCSITNSLGQKLLIIKTVVICLKNRTFAVSQTALRYTTLFTA